MFEITYHELHTPSIHFDHPVVLTAQEWERGGLFLLWDVGRYLILKSDHWPMWLRVVSSDWQWLSRVSERESFLALFENARSQTWDLLHARQALCS